MNPTSLPELFKPSRDLRNLQKSKFLGVKIFRKFTKNPFKVLYITFKRPLKAFKGPYKVVVVVAVVVVAVVLALKSPEFVFSDVAMVWGSEDSDVSPFKGL